MHYEYFYPFKGSNRSQLNSTNFFHLLDNIILLERHKRTDTNDHNNVLLFQNALKIKSLQETNICNKTHTHDKGSSGTTKRHVFTLISGAMTFQKISFSSDYVFIHIRACVQICCYSFFVRYNLKSTK